MKICPQCNTQLDDGCAFCPSCGTKFIEDAEIKRCGFCGNEIEEGAKFCPSCGSILETTNSNLLTPPTNAGKVDTDALLKKAGGMAQSVAVKAQTAASKVALSLKSDDPVKKKKSIKIISAVVAAVVVLGIAIGLMANSAKYTKIDLKQMSPLVVEGLNGKGYITEDSDSDNDTELYMYKKMCKAIDLDPDDIYDMDDLMNSFDNIMSSYSDNSGLKSEQIKKIKKITRAFQYLHREEIEKNGELSNGDKVKIKFTYDKELMKDARIKIKNAEYELKVKDLEEGKPLDVFAGLKLKYSGISPKMSAEIDKSDCEEFVRNNISFSISSSNGIKKGDKITVTASFDQDKVDENKYLINEKEREYTVSGGSEFLSSLEGVNITELEKEMNDKIKAYNASYYSDVTTGGLKSKYFMKLKDTASTSYNSYNNELVYIYEYQKANETDQVVAIGITAYNLVKTEEGKLEWNYTLDVDTSSTIDSLTNDIVNSKVDKYVVSKVD